MNLAAVPPPPQLWKSLCPAPRVLASVSPRAPLERHFLARKAQANRILSLPLNALLFNFITLSGLAALHSKAVRVFPPPGKASPNRNDQGDFVGWSTLLGARHLLGERERVVSSVGLSLLQVTT